jgi:peroxiredoxin
MDQPMKLLPLLLLPLFVSSSFAVADSAATVEPLPLEDFKRIAGQRSVTIAPSTRTVILNFAEGIDPIPPQIAAVADKLRADATAISLEALMPLLDPERGQAISEKMANHDDPLVQFVANIVLTGSGNSETAKTVHALIHDESLAQMDKRLIRTWCDGVGIRAANDDAAAIFGHLSTLFSKAPKFKKGDVAPAFKAETTEGHELSSSQLKGKVIVLHFWSTWCRPCMAKMPSHIESLKGYDSKAVEIVYVSLDEDKDAFEAAVSKHGIPFTNVREGSGWGGNLVRAFGVNSVPFDIVIGRDGKVFSNSIDDLDAVVAVVSTPSQDEGRAKP